MCGCDPSLPPYDHDPDRARELLAEAGLRGQEVLIHSPLSLPEEAPRLTRTPARQLREIGLEPRIEIHEDRFEYARSIAEKQLQGLFCFDSSPLEYLSGAAREAGFQISRSLVAGLSQPGGQ